MLLLLFGSGGGGGIPIIDPVDGIDRFHVPPETIEFPVERDVLLFVVPR